MDITAEIVSDVEDRAEKTMKHRVANVRIYKRKSKRQKKIHRIRVLKRIARIKERHYLKS